jgi:four helix bundle protein
MELETQVLIAERLGYVTSSDARDLLQSAAEVGKVLNGLVNSLQKSIGN